LVTLNILISIGKKVETDKNFPLLLIYILEKNKPGAYRSSDRNADNRSSKCC